MSNWYDLYVTDVLSTGDTSSEQFVNSTQEYYDLMFKESPNYVKDATWNNNPIDIRLLSINSEKNNLPVDERKKILIRDLSLKVNYGDYMTFWNDTWIVVDKKVSSPASNTCTVERCNFNLKTILPNGKSINYPCSIRKMSKANLNIITKENIQVPKMEFFIEIPNNNDTISIPYSWRLLFGKMAYKVIDKQDLVPVGILELKITSDNIREDKDNFTTGIADNSVQEIPIPTGNLIIQGNKQLNVNKINEYTLVYDNGGNPSGTYLWSISDTSKVSIVSQTNTTIQLKGITTGQVTLQVTDNSTFTLKKTINVQIGW